MASPDSSDTDAQQRSANATLEDRRGETFREVGSEPEELTAGGSEVTFSSEGKTAPLAFMTETATASTATPTLLAGRSGGASPLEFGSEAAMPLTFTSGPPNDQPSAPAVALDTAAPEPLPPIPPPLSASDDATPPPSSSPRTGAEEDVMPETPTCRVCRSDDTFIGPLFHPCRCTGSIAHVHQDCLSTWLEHSRKASCELCGYKFSFENVYKEGAPSRPPMRTILLEAVREMGKGTAWIARCFLVSLAWLAIVPLTVKVINNGGLHAGDWTVRSFVMALPRANFSGDWNVASPPTVNLSTTLVSNATAASRFAFVSRLAPSRLMQVLPSHKPPAPDPFEARRAIIQYATTVLLNDILQGQIITCAIVVAFVIIFLLREYIIQNLPMDALQALGLAADPFAGLADEPPAVQPALQEPRRAIPAGVMPEAALAEEVEARLRVIGPGEGADVIPGNFTDSTSIENARSDGAGSSEAGLLLGSASEPESSAEDDSVGASSSGYHSDSIGDILPAPTEPEDIEPPAAEPEADNRAGGGAGNAIEAGPVLPPIQREPEGMGALEEGEADDFVLEDLDGLLEAIGFRGGLLTLASSVGLVVLVLGGSLFLFVHVPHFIGKMCILFRADLALGAPFRGLLVLRNSIHRLLDKAAALAIHLRPAKLAGVFRHQSSSFRARDLADSFQVAQAWLSWQQSVQSANKTIFALGSSFGDTAAKARLSYATLRAQVLEINTRIEAVPSGRAFNDRVIAVLYGYSAFLSLCLLYLLSGIDRTRSRIIGTALGKLLRQVGVIVKVGFFVFVELMVFPTVCGVLLHFATYPAFPDATLRSRAEKFQRSPGTFTLVVWIAGTCFMFLFAMLVSACRDSLRPGVCWWIRDPGDPRYHPIRDIISRPTFSQLRKITASAFMYGAVVFLGVGAILGAMSICAGVIPLRLHPDRAWSQTAAELVLYQNLVPVLVRVLKPREQLRQHLDRVSRGIAHRLRLTNFLYGEKIDSEETKVGPMDIWLARLTRLSPWRRPNSPWEKDLPAKVGGFMRVPGADSVLFVPGRKMHIPVTEHGVPLHPEDRALIQQQQREARAEAGARPGEDTFIVVYMPPHFRLRMIGFVTAMWLTSIGSISASLSVPILAGRYLLDTLWLEEQHDIYAFICGAFLLASVYVSATLIVRTTKTTLAIVRAMRVDPAPFRRRLPVFNWQFVLSALRGLAVVVESAVCVILAALVTPVLASLVVELYALAPLRSKANPLPTIYLADNWANGMMYVVLGARIVHAHRLLSAPQEIETLCKDNKPLDAMRLFHRRLLLPFSAALLFAIVAPAAAVGPIILLMPSRILAPLIRRAGWEAMSSAEHFFLLLKSFYPALPGWASHYITSRLVVKMLNQWMGKVRDKAFLDHRRLRNYEATAPGSTPE